jgi:hypothetical protein
MTQKEIKQKMKALDVAWDKIDKYFEPRYKKATTLERIKIRGVQMCISEIVELEIELSKEEDK